jgi:hypothetical protein
MDTSVLQLFADNYSSKDFDKIKFDWNGERGDKFFDNNSKFRMELWGFLIPQLDTVKIELIRDLYSEISKYAKEAWGLPMKYPLFAQQLLNRGGTDYIMDYLFGAMQCFDTVLASGAISLTKEKKQNILNFIMEEMKSEKSEERIRLLKFGQDRFQQGY